MFRSLLTRRAILSLALVALFGTDLLAAKVPSFKRRSDDEKRFVGEVGETIVKAAHSSAQKVAMVEHRYTSPKTGRNELTIKMEYFGKATGKKYLAEIVVKIDSLDKNAWEVLTIDYTDNNNIPFSRKKVDELIKELNR